MQSGVIVVDLIMGLIFMGGLLSIILNSRKKGRCFRRVGLTKYIV